MDKIQELKYRFASDTSYRFADMPINDIEQFIDDFNYTGINATITQSKYAKRAGLTQLKTIMPIIEHIIAPIEKAFYDSVCGIYSPIPHSDTIKPEQYRRIQSDQPIPFTKTIQHNNHRTKENILHLGTYTRCICAETGISFAVALPNPLHITFTLLHPFAFYPNVIAEIKECQKTGYPVSSFDSQALAGMLITILKHKGYAVCRDYVAANARLRQVNRKSLTWALSYFHKATMRQNLPQINLLADGNPTTQLIGFIQICKGEDSSLQAHHVFQTKEKKITARVFQTEHAKESAELRNDIKSCRSILERIQKDNTHVSDTLYTQIDQRISKIAVMNDTAKENLIADIIGAFGDTANTKALALIIRANDMTATQKELLSFSMEIEKDLEGFKTNKKPISFAELMGKVK